MKTAAVVVMGISVLCAFCAPDAVQAKRQLLTPGTCSEIPCSSMKQLNTLVLCSQGSEAFFVVSCQTCFSTGHFAAQKYLAVLLLLTGVQTRSLYQAHCMLWLAGCTTILPPGPVCDVFCGKAFPTPGHHGHSSGCSCKATCSGEMYECTKDGPNSGCSCFCDGARPQIMGEGECHRFY